MSLKDSAPYQNEWSFRNAIVPSEEMNQVFGIMSIHGALWALSKSGVGEWMVVSCLIKLILD